MSMVDHDDPDVTPDRFGMHIGVVTDTADPLKAGRVRVRIPGIYEPQSPWCFPMGVPGGGTSDRGLWWVPDVGSDVAIFFNRGDEDAPYYMPANWGQGQPPTSSEDGDVDVVTVSTKEYNIVIDGRTGQKKFTIVDKAADDNVLEFNGQTRKLTIKATAGITIESVGEINIQGLLVRVNGVVAGSGLL